MLTDEEITAFVEVGYEQRAVEFKGPGSPSGDFIANVARAAMALANQRDGGHVIIGVAEKKPSQGQATLSADQLKQWANYDNVVDQINRFADPPLSMNIYQREAVNNIPVIVITVQEFGDIPILCKRDSGKGGKLVRGHLYTRSMAKPESSSTNTQNELRQVLDLATEKQLVRFVETAGRTGIALASARVPEANDPFLEQRSDFEREPGTLDVLQTANMFMYVTPSEFDAKRIDYTQLEPNLKKCIVRADGQEFPMSREIKTGSDWISGEHIEARYPEIWRFYQSGMFVNYQTISTRYQADWDSFMKPEEGDHYLPIWLPLLYFAKAFAFASRLQRALPEESFELTFGLDRVKDWVLVTDNPNRSGLRERYSYGSDKWQRKLEITPEIAIGSYRELMVQPLLDLFNRFGWTGITAELIRGMQEEIIGPATG